MASTAPESLAMSIPSDSNIIRPLGLAISAPFAAVPDLPVLGHVQELSFPLPECPSVPTGVGDILEDT